MNVKRSIIEKLGGNEVKRILEAFDGHKTQLGIVLAMLPDIANQLVTLLASLTGLFTGLHMDGAAANLAHASGLILAGVGAVHKVIKIVLPLLKG